MALKCEKPLTTCVMRGFFLANVKQLHELPILVLEVFGPSVKHPSFIDARHLPAEKGPFGIGIGTGTNEKENLASEFAAFDGKTNFVQHLNAKRNDNFCTRAG